MIKNIPKRWRDLSGQNSWKNLLYPLDSDLQKYILHYGAMAQATYDTFNANKLSKYAGSSLYARRNLFSKVGLVNANPFKYEAVKYIYAMANICVPDAFLVQSLSNDSYCKQSNWIGYVAVATNEGKSALGRRDILIAWRGTVEKIEWAKDIDFPLVPAKGIVGNGGDNANVHEGFLSMYTSSDPESRFNKTSARDQVISEVKRQVEQYKNETISITITGHSLGAALSTLNAADIVANDYNKPKDQPKKQCPVTVFNFGSPRVGDSNFKDILQSMKDLRVLSVHNVPDIVTRLPPVGYSNVGVELHVDSSDSPFLISPGNISTWHDLEAGYLHSVAREGGTQVTRDISLINKNTSALLNKYLIPTNWWCERNKGMVQNKSGSWSLHDHEKDN
ncbi:hypothetical protein BUALT_Bualt03G0206600 [Buddleja alternifolia]|uniref:Phospholipase A1 n=1 Tax=Buddleja alternifolia TaxID=168488 RepID=A0AAV6XVF7_9LAMI|nr:hypothetical protein BUALT_Bualt03G0206600 [Buddleja alternifolia]